jgi:crotonobetainyl-CoA:carnitine CoA-transferase CaiB-like acyl-CoA transferase
MWELDNRNKKSLTLDLSRPEGREIIHKLIATTDVFLSNLRPYELEKFELDYGTLTRIKPDLVFAHVTGYGPGGPDRDSPGYDFTAFWARSGIMHMKTPPGATPPAARPGFGDHTTSLALVSAVLLGLLTRERTGIAQQVSVSLFHTGLWVLGMDVQSTLATDKESQQYSRLAGKNPLTNFYQTKDKRWIMVTHVQPDPYWPDFCRAVGRADLEQDSRFGSFEARVQNSRELIDILDKEFATRTLDEWKERLDAHGLIWSVVQTLTEVVKDQQAWANEYFLPLDHPQYGRIHVVASPVKLSATPATVRMPAPGLGEHTEAILGRLGYSREAIAELRSRGVA